MNSIELKTDQERLLIAIRRTGLPGWKVAQNAGINHPELSQFLSGTRTPSRDVCKALAMAVKIPIEVLFPDTLERLDNGIRGGT